MQRVVRGRAATISVDFNIDVDDVVTPPSAVDVQVLRDDGTELVASTAADDATGGKFTYTLTPAQTVDLDRLTARWTATFDGHVQTIETTVEIAGGVVFTIAQARRVSALGDPDTYSDDDVRAARTRAERELEQACGFAFVPRYGRERVALDFISRRIRLSWWKVREVRSITADGEPFTAGELAEIRVYGRTAHSGSRLFLASADIDVAYEHGLDTPPPDADRAALLLAEHYLVRTGISARAESVTTDAGTVRLAGEIPEVEAFIRDNRRPVGALLA